MAYFQITPDTPSLNLPAWRGGQFSFTVTSNLDRTVRIQASPVPDGGAKPEWLSIRGEAVRDLTPTEAQTFVVQVHVPDDVPAGEQRFRLLVANVARPEDEYDASPPVAFTIPVAAPHPVQWWMIAAPVGILLLAIGGFFGFRALQPPGLGKRCDPAKANCRSGLVCPQRDGGQNVCLAALGTECHAGADCVTGVCEGRRDGGTGAVCVLGCAPETDADFCKRLGNDCGVLTGTDNCGAARTVASCGSCGAPKTCGGGGTPNVCGCTETDAEFCKRLGKDCGGLTGTDKCGAARRVASCGNCAAPRTCGGGGTPNVCGCTDTDADFCKRLGKDCGAVAGTDKCGAARTVASCGACAAPKTCGGGGTPNVCGCAETDADFCKRLGKDCGGVTGTDKCGAARTVASCGSCAAPKTCGGGGTPNVCGCTDTDAEFCKRLGKDCGAITGTDKCGAARTVASCGSCAAPRTCGGGGTPNVCDCPPESDAAFCQRLNKDCGTVAATDYCGRPKTAASCGNCAAPRTCGGDGRPNVCGCPPESDAAFCQRLNKDCGTVAGTDYCGRSKTAASCGNCAAPRTCGGSGTPNVCGCPPESDSSFCQRLQKSCGSASGADNCGVSRTVGFCGTCPWAYACVNGSCAACGDVDQQCCPNGACRRGGCTSGYCKVSLPQCFWSDWFSEEGSGQMHCSNSWAVRGVKCTGNYCDNMYLYCCPYSDTADGSPRTTGSWFSEEGGGSSYSDTGVVTGGYCSGNNCDNMRIEFVTTPKLQRYGACFDANSISEENPNGYTCPDGYWVTGWSCRGSNCDNVALRCCPARLTWQ